MKTALVPPTTGKKKKARRVFGDVAVDDLDSSLSYSPSPQGTEMMETTTGSPHRSMHLGFHTLDNENLSGINGELSQSSEVYCSELKENTKNLQVHFSKDSTNPAANKMIQDHFRNMCTFSRSPVRPDLVKKTQDAINKANVSMKNFSQSIATAQKAKADFHSDQRRVTSKMRQNWKADTTEAKTLIDLTEQNRRKFLSLQRQLSSKYSKEKARREQSKRHEALNQIEKEIHFKSEVFRDHQSKLKQNEDDKRRKSVAVRAKIRTNHRLGEEKLKLGKFQEEQAIIDERHAASMALRDTTTQINAERRKSFAFRNGDARRIRQLHSIMVQQRRQKDHKSYELKWQAEKDVRDHISNELQARRQSLANRNVASRNLRKLEDEVQQNFLTDQHMSYELKWEAERDVKNYLRSQEDERRQSLHQRNLEGKRQRDFLNHQHAETVSAEHKSFELSWAAENDADMYRRNLEKAKRESLAFRNAEGRRQRHFSQQEQSALACKIHESYELKWAGENDAAAYVAKLDDERRESFVNRNVEARRQRAWEVQHQVETGMQDHENYELQRAASKDVENYVSQQDQLRRESFKGRNKERAQHAKVIEELRMLALERESESYVLKWAGENDAKEYLAKLDEERRSSLKLRGQQTLHNRQIENEQKNKQLVELHETEALRAIDHQEMETYIKKCAERDRASFEYRRKDTRIQRLQEEEMLMTRREQELNNQKLETLARFDVVDYVNDCMKRRRMSLACRAKEKRKQAQWCRLKKKKEIDEQSRRVHDQLMDQKYVELAKQKDRARLALNAIRHAGYTFNKKM